MAGLPNDNHGKIVLTGAPSTGKTSTAAVLHHSYGTLLTTVPDAAALLWTGGFPSGDSELEVRARLRAVYAVQRELEEIMALRAHGGALVCDRGSLDALVEWPGSEEDFFEEIGSSMGREIARYDWVLHLDIAPPASLHRSREPTDDERRAEILNQKVKWAWRLHPRRLIIPASDSFLDKLHVARRIVGAILNGGENAFLESLIVASPY